MRELPARARQLWNCGYLDRLPGNRGAYPLPEAAPRPDCDTCPGYLIALPVVLEAQELWMWWEKGQLTAIARGTKSVWLKEAVERMAGAHAEVDIADEGVAVYDADVVEVIVGVDRDPGRNHAHNARNDKRLHRGLPSAAALMVAIVTENGAGGKVA